MGEETAAMGSTIALATNNDQTAPANEVDEQPPPKEKERTPSNSATSTAISSFWSAKPTKPISSGNEKQKSVVNLVLGDSDELTDQSDDDADPGEEEERSEVSKDLKEEDDENEYREILKRKSICQNCERDARPNCVLAPRIGRYPRCVRCRDKDWRCSFLPMKNGEYAAAYKKSAHHHKPGPHFPIDVDIKPVIPKDPPIHAKAHRGPGRPPKNRNAQAGTSKATTSALRVAPYDRSLRRHLPSSSGTGIAHPTFSVRIPPSSTRTAAGSGPAPNSSPLAHRSTSSASNLLRRAAHNALAAEEGTGVSDNRNNSQLLDALSKMSRALRLSSEAFQLLADYQRGKPPNNNEPRDGRGARDAPMVLE